MKRLTLTLFATVVTLCLNAQGAMDALRFSQIRYEGTARSMAMGNAFTSLGGDSYSISINPASSGIYRYSEFTITPGLSLERNVSDYLSNKESENWIRPVLSNLGFITNIKTGSGHSGVKSISFGVAINRLNNFSSRSFSYGINSQSSWLGSLAEGLGGVFKGNLDINDNWNPFFDFPGAKWREILAWNSNLLDPLPDSDYDYIGATENINSLGRIVIGGPLNQEFYRETTGNISEVVFNTAVNISDKLFIGANIGVQSLYYSDYQRFSESAINPANFQSRFSSFRHVYRQTSNGAGVNFKVGLIALPVEGLRVGASISTPTWQFINDKWDESIDARYSDGYTSNILSPVGEYNYRVNTPFRWNIGASYVFGKSGLISADYESTDYSSILMLTESGDKHEFRVDNNYIKDNFRSAGILRLGAEIKPVPNTALRAGYTKYDNPEKNFGYDVHMVSGGLGFSGRGGGFLDIALQKRLGNRENYSLYDDYTNHKAPVGKMEMDGWRFLVTLGFRF